MIPTLYDKTGNNKIGDLTDAIECLVEEERNGIFELTMVYPANSSILESIVYDNIIVADANDYLKSQKFRIYNTRKLMANRIEICARHISFDLAHDWVDSISIENQSCEYALNTIFRNSQFSNHFKGHSDIINAQNFKVNKVTCLEAIGGTSGSIIDTYGTGAEILRDNTDIHVLNRRGRDNDVVIEYRKNLTGLEVEEDTTDLVTRIMPYAIYTDEDNQEVEVRGDFIDSPLINNYAHPYVKYIDYSEKFEDDEVPTATKLNNLATKEYTNNKVDIPKCNYKIEFIPLSKCAGYEGLEDRINLCDVVTVKDSRYNIDTQAKVIKVVFDVLRGRYDSMELGEPRTTLGDIIGGTGDGPTQGPPGPPGPQGPAGADGSIGDFPETLPEVPNITAKVYGFANIEISWTFENKVYYSYELYASKTKGFAPNTFNLIFSGQASTYLYQAEPNETWYFRACALNTHGQRTEFSEEVQVSTVKISDLSNYVESAAIGDALIGELNLGRGWYGELRGNYIDAKQMSVTDGNGKRTLDIDSFGNVNLDVTSLKIRANSVATEPFVTTAKNDAITSANNTLNTTIANYYTKSETDSKISVAKDEINLGVSNKYETKANVETKVSSTLSSAKSYADTKKTEAINSAATDATSKVNAAKSELNTAIGKKANTVDVYSKAEVYTKGQTDSAIKVAKDEINLGVSNTYETKANVETKITSIQVGATNKLVGTATSKNTNVNVPSSYVVWDPYTTHNKQTLEQLGFKIGDKVTVGFDWAISKNGSNNYVYGNFRVEFKGIKADGTDNQFVGVIKNPAATFSSSNTKGRVEATVTLDSNNIKAHSIRFRVDNSVLNFKVSNVKLEKGTKATSWSPAPEDITTDITTAKNDAISSASTDAANKANNAKNEAINSANATLTSTIANYYTKAQTDSQINVAKDAITQSVSSTYETKTEVTNKINAVQVGTRNLARPTSGDWASRTNFSGGENQTWYPSKIYLDTLSVGDEVTYSFDIEYSGITVNNGASTFRLTIQGSGNSTGWTTALPGKGVSLNIGSGSTRISQTFKITSEHKKNSFFDFGFRTDYVNGGTIKYRCGMASKGNKVVQWSPAPEDITTNINNAKTDAINAAATDASNKVNSAKNELNTEINKKANSADVYKKTEVYTKNETNSQITTAKNEINQSVSSTYETKTNVTTKIDAIQIGGRNLIKQTKLLTSANLGSWVITNTGNEGFKKLEIVTTNTGWLECQIPLYTEINTITKDVTISFEYHETSSELLMFSFAAYNGNTRVYEITNVTVSSSFKIVSTNGNWKTVCYTFNPTSTNGKDGANQYRVQFKKASGKTGTIYVRKPKLELGNKATSWTPAPEDMETTVSGIEQRVSSAESKITDTAITNTVKKNFYTKEETNNQITSKGYQTSSQVQQTVDNLQIKFTESGGYNLLKNGKAALNTNFWASNGGGIARNTHSVYKTCFKTSLPSGIKYNGGDNGGAIRLKNNTHYVYEAQIFSKTAISGNGTVPLHFWCGTTATTAGQSQCTIVDYQQAVPKINTWTKCYVHFLTKPSGEVWFTPFIYAGGDLTGDIWVTELSLSESSIQMPYSPHPSEIYDGITTIDKDGINVSTSYGAHTQFHAGGMSSYNNSNQRTLGIENGGISFHAWNNNALAAYITQSSLWGGDQSASGLAISTTKNGAYLALGTSPLSDVNTTLNMDQALTISANDSFQPKGINFWKDVHAHGYGIRQLSHLKLAGSGAIQFDYLNNSPSTIYEAVDSGHSLYVMGGYQMHLGVMEGSGTPHGVIWMRGKTDTHSYTHWDFHNYTMYNMKTASTYANYDTRRISESYGVTSND